MISTEKVFDLLPVVVEIYEKLDVEKLAKGFKKGTSQKEAGRLVFLHIMKNSTKIKNEVFEIIAVLEDITVEEAKVMGITTSFEILKSLFSDFETITFFKQAMQ